jgi:zinc transporter, ZIP family
MADLGASIAWGLVIGGSLLVGATAAVVLRLPATVAALVTAFGGGVLFAAIALELVPEADGRAGTALTAAGLLAGTLVYVTADKWLARDEDAEMMRRSGHAAAAGMKMEMPEDSSEIARGETIAAGIFVDGVPESIALGLTISEGEVGVALLAGIVIGNVVESYGAAQPILAAGRSSRFALILLGAIGLALAFSTVLGGTVLADASDGLVGTAQAVAAGAVLAVVSIAVIPYAFSQVNTRVATAMVIGFAVGYVLS